MRKLRILAVASAISIISTMTSMANWEQQTGGQWKYQNTDGSYAVGWQWLDGNGDGVAECYYLGTDGTMAVSTVIGGYTVDINGAWIIDGVVQTKVVGSGGQTSTNNSGFTVPSLSIGNVDSGSWEAECGDSTGLPPMQ